MQTPMYRKNSFEMKRKVSLRYNHSCHLFSGQHKGISELINNPIKPRMYGLLRYQNQESLLKYFKRGKDSRERLEDEGELYKELFGCSLYSDEEDRIDIIVEDKFIIHKPMKREDEKTAITEGFSQIWKDKQALKGMIKNSYEIYKKKYTQNVKEKQDYFGMKPKEKQTEKPLLITRNKKKVNKELRHFFTNRDKKRRGFSARPPPHRESR